MTSSLTVYAYDAILPLLRPDSYVTCLTSDLYGIWTPSSAPQMLKMGDEETLVSELQGIGTTVKVGNTTRVATLTEPDYWEHQRKVLIEMGYDAWEEPEPPEPADQEWYEYDRDGRFE